MIPCTILWCVCLAAPDGIACVVHRQRPNLRLGDGPLDLTVLAQPCATCDGHGACHVCKGTGHHECDDWECGARHVCGACDGGGECADCDGQDGIDPSLTDADRAYLGWALDLPHWHART